MIAVPDQRERQRDRSERFNEAAIEKLDCAEAEGTQHHAVHHNVCSVDARHAERR